jgi:hypothetical protein
MPARFISKRFTIVLCVLLSFAVWRYANSPWQPDPSFYAADAHFEIGGKHLVLPVHVLTGRSQVFGPGYGAYEGFRETIEGKTRDAARPFRLNKLALRIESYILSGKGRDESRLCRLLSPRWQVLCEQGNANLAGQLPFTFDVYDRNHLVLLKHSSTVGKENRFDQLRQLTLEPGKTEVACDQGSQFCTAAVEVLPGVVSVWTVWNDPEKQQTARQMARPQGAALVEFFKVAVM